jgi:hypothetical protein
VVLREEIAAFCNRDRCETEQPHGTNAVTEFFPPCATDASVRRRRRLPAQPC